MIGCTPFPRSIGIIGLAEFVRLIYGLQQLRGKILSPKDLAYSAGTLAHRCGQYEIPGDLGQGRMNRVRMWKTTKAASGWLCARSADIASHTANQQAQTNGRTARGQHIPRFDRVKHVAHSIQSGGSDYFRVAD